MDIFAYASRKKLRFETPKGNLSTEDLWDLPLTAKEGNLSIDVVGKAMTNAVRDNEGNEAFVVVEGSEVDPSLKIRLGILEHIRDHKVNYANRVEKAILTKAKKQRLMELLEKKKGEALEDHSVEEIEKMLEEL